MEKEFLDIDKRNAWARVFQEIKNESNNYCHIIKDAKKSENKNLNRYRDVNPFDHSRVKLQRGDKDYINASMVKVPAADRSYILTQGPLPVTTGHFWLMVWEQNSKAILMLNRVIEKNAVKCHQYWPIGYEYDGEDDLILPDVNLQITFLSQKDQSNYILREFQITDLESQDSRDVLQFHYTTWPDFGVPESPSAFLDFLFTVRESGALNSNVGPPVVHCSAGIGRSGTFCLVDSCLVLIEKNGDTNSVNIRQCLLEMRHYRMGLIQTPDQLRFSYLAIIEGAKKILPQEDSLNVPLSNENNLQEPDVQSDRIQELSSLEAGEISEKHPLSQDVSSKSHVPSSSSDSLSEMRKRSRKEREEKTASIVQNIKKKQKETEVWEKRRSKRQRRE